MLFPKGSIFVRVNRWVSADDLQIFFGMRDPQTHSLWLADPIQPVFRELKEGECFPHASISIPGMYSGEILKAFADAVSEVGIKPESQGKLEGLLEARTETLEQVKSERDYLRKLFEQIFKASFPKGAP